MAQINMIDRGAVDVARVLFITLTMPGSWGPERNVEGRRHLLTFQKRFERYWGKRPIVWKRELQKRGVVHYHLLALGPEWIEQDSSLWYLRQWISRTWYEVVGSGEETHLLAGTQVQRSRGWQSAAGYFGKYLGKAVEPADSTNPAALHTLPPGRNWGAWCKRLLPIFLDEHELPWEAGVRLRRWVCRYLKWKVRAPYIDGRAIVQGLEAYVPCAVACRLEERALAYSRAP